MKKIKYGPKIVDTLKRISKNYPTQSISSHLSIALQDYVNLDIISDKELFYLLEKYECEKELDLNPTDINKIIDEGMNLDVNDIYDETDDDIY